MTTRVGSEDPRPTTRTIADLRTEFERADLARHLASFYRSPDTQLAVAVAYVGHGLETGHRCLYLADVNDVDRIETALRSGGVDVDERVADGDLLLRDASEVYLDSGFDPRRMIGTLEDHCEGSVDAGYEGLRVAGENSWCFHAETSFDHVLDFEAEFDATCPDLPVTALCQYDLTMFGERSAAKALWTHEQIVYRNTVCENPYYIRPGEYRSMADPYLNVRLMLDQTYSLTRARQQVDRREQRLAVLNRILRHNIRNELNFIRGVLHHVRETETLASDNETRVTNAIQHADDVVAMADKARHVQQSISDATVERVDLGPVVDRAVATAADAHPDAEIRITGETDRSVFADARLDAALTEAITNAVVHQDGDPPVVSLAVSTPSDDRVRIAITDPGPPIPDAERQAVQHGNETQLEHGSGLGLWLTKWVVENAHGTIEFPDSEHGEGHLRVELRRAEA